MHTLNRILIIRFSSVGDIVLSSLLVRVLRHRFPQTQIDYLVKAEFGDLLASNPYLTQVIPYQKDQSIGALEEFRQYIRGLKYDLVIDLHGSIRSHYLCIGARPVVRIDKRRFPRFLLVRCKVNLYNRFGGAPSVALRYLEPVARLGVVDDGSGLDLFVPTPAVERVNRLVHTSGFDGALPPIGICPAAKHGNKMWPAERFAEAAAVLATETGSGVILFGWKGPEEGLCRIVEQRIRQQAPATTVLNTSGALSLPETAAMMDHCSLVVSNDTGLMHIAAARKRKLVAIFGPTVHEFGFYPFRTQHIVVENMSLHCRPCTHIGLPECPKRHFKCMNDIPASRVVEAARNLLHH